MASQILILEQFEYGNMANIVYDTGNFIVHNGEEEETCEDSQVERDYAGEMERN